MSSIYQIDFYANTLESFFHKRSVITKILFMILVLAAIVVSQKLLMLFFIFVILLYFLIRAKISLIYVLRWLVFPLFFASIFALSQFRQPHLAALTMLRATDSVLLCLFIICTTPFPEIFALLGKISPFLSNIFFLTYRFFFLLIEEIETRVKMIRVRGFSRAGLRQKFNAAATLIGRIFISTIDRSEKVFYFLRVRGYRRFISLSSKYKISGTDIALVFLGMVIFFFAL